MGREKLAALFADWEETMVWSCLQGVMGRLVGNGDDTAAVIVSGDFSFFAGRPDEKLIALAPGPILVPRDEAWSAAIEVFYGPRAVRETRYAIKKEPDVFNREKLAAFAAAIPTGYTLRAIDEAMVSVLQKEEWSEDFCSNFDGPSDFICRGLGVAALYDGVPVAGASSYTVYQGGIEIEIDTREDHRGRGLATACGARLILACLDRGLYPSWDAYDLRSVHLAEKLGYHPAGPYPVYWVGGDDTTVK